MIPRIQQQVKLQAATKPDQSMNQRRQQLEDLIASLEQSLTTKLFQHRKFIEASQSVEEERNF